MLKHIVTLSALTIVIALAGVAFAYHSEKADVPASRTKAAQTMEPILPFDEKLVTPM